MTSLFRELWDRRSLVLLLAINDVKLRYRNSILGFFWTFLEPLLMLSVLYFVFTNIIKSGIENYPLYLLLGLIIWNMFSRATTGGLSSLVDRGSIIQKIYFRRELIVISSCLTAFIMMAFEFIAFAIFVVFFGFVPKISIVILPLILIDLFVLSLGFSLLFSSLNVYFRDIKFIWQVILQAGFFLSPIIYKLDMFPEHVRTLLKLNPMVPLLDAAHGLVLYNSLPSSDSLIYLLIFTLVITVVGYIVFRVNDKRIVEAL